MFERTRFRLTFWYLLIIMSISFAFSVSIYKLTTLEVERFAYSQQLRIERRQFFQQDNILPQALPFPATSVDLDLVVESKQRIIFTLLFVNGIVLFAAGGLSYFLAGKTLKPIQLMIDEQNRFISDASHELRTPLTALKTMMEVALRDKSFAIDEAKILISDNIQEVNKLQLLSEQLLDLTQYEKTHTPIQKKTVEFTDIVNKAKQKIHVFATQKNITFQVDNSQVSLFGNADSLIDLLVILLDNAIKYSPSHSTIYIEGKKTNFMTQMIIRDEGIGISKKDLPHVFDRFYRTDGARQKEHTGGYGLGLSIAKKIVDRHQGTIKVESKPNIGTTFTVFIPHRRHKIPGETIFSQHSD